MSGEEHPPATAVYAGRSNAKHRHNSSRGVVYRNHWFSVYRCPICGKQFKKKHGRLPVCRGPSVPIQYTGKVIEIG